MSKEQKSIKVGPRAKAAAVDLLNKTCRFEAEALDQAAELAEDCECNCLLLNLMAARIVRCEDKETTTLGEAMLGLKGLRGDKASVGQGLMLHGWFLVGVDACR